MDLVSIVNRRKGELNKEMLLGLLSEWTVEVRQLKDMRVKELYKMYLEYFDNLDFSLFSFDRKYIWYSFEDLITYNFRKEMLLSSFERPFVIVRDVLWELLVFKSDLECTCCGNDNFRIMVNEIRTAVFGVCDVCGCSKLLYGKADSIEAQLYPATQNIVETYGFTPSAY